MPPSRGATLSIMVEKVFSASAVVELVEVHVARVGTGHVLVDRDLGEPGDPRGRDVADVDEVAPVAQLRGRVRVYEG